MGCAGGRGVAADLGARGGVLAGLPVITSQSCSYGATGGLIALIDAGAIVLVDEGVEFRVGREAAVEMSDAPTGSSTAPTAATTQVSMFQVDAAALIVSAKLVVGVDTGLTHMGMASGTPTLALFGATRPYLESGQPRTRVLYDALPCSPCRRRPTCNGEFPCMRGIAPEQAAQAALQLLPA